MRLHAFLPVHELSRLLHAARRESAQAAAPAAEADSALAVQAVPLVAAGPATKHWGPVWHLRWQSRPSQGEFLVTTAADGRLTQWSLARVRPRQLACLAAHVGCPGPSMLHIWPPAA